jgi:ATP-dependent Clp protease adaptor protein ClpS
MRVAAGKDGRSREATVIPTPPNPARANSLASANTLPRASASSLGRTSALPRASEPSSTPGGATVLDKAPERVRKTSPRYKVLLHNDPVNTMEYVVMTLQQVVPSLSEQDAIAVMLETHNTGVGLVIVCDIEPAEFYCETLKAKGLSSTIEPES